MIKEFFDFFEKLNEKKKVIKLFSFGKSKFQIGNK